MSGKHKGMIDMTTKEFNKDVNKSKIWEKQNHIQQIFLNVVDQAVAYVIL